MGGAMRSGTVEISDDLPRKKSCFLRILALFWVPFLIFLASVAGFLGFIPLRVELYSVVMIGIIFLIFLFMLKHNAYYASCLFKKRSLDFRTDLQIYMQNNLLTIGELTKANASFDNFVKEYSGHLRNENFSSVASGIFPTLGILGTFISIALSMPDFSSKTSAVLEQEISLLLGGVGTAFYVSIYGIFLSIWWIFYEKSGVSRFEHTVAKMKEATRHQFWDKEEIEQTYFQKSMENYEKLNTVFNHIGSSELIESLNATLTQRLEMFDNIIMQEKQAVQKSSNHFNMILEESEKAVEARDKMHLSYQQITQNLQLFSSRIHESTIMLESVNQKLSDKQTALREIEKNLNLNIQTLNDSLHNLNADNIQALYKGIQKNIETMKHDTDRIGWTFNQHLNDFDEKYVERLKISLEMIDSETAKIIRQLAQLHKS